MAYLRAACLALVIIGFLLLALPLQWLLMRLNLRARHRIPMLFHRAVCSCTGLRVTVFGTPSSERPQMIVANHVSWLDVPALGAHAPLCFLAKKEVGAWPVIGAFARLNGCLFVDRTRKRGIPQVNRQIAGCIGGGDLLVLFPEATTSDGNRLMKFHSPHFEAAIGADGAAAALQPVAIVYTRRNGLPFDRRTRPAIAWYGDMALLPHLWGILRGGPVDCALIYGAPIRVTGAAGRKQLAVQAKDAVRAALAKPRGR